MLNNYKKMLNIPNTMLKIEANTTQDSNYIIQRPSNPRVSKTMTANLVSASSGPVKYLTK